MAAFFAPLLPFALRWGARVFIAGGATWVGTRLYQNKGNLPKSYTALREDIVHGYLYITNKQYQALGQAGKRLQAKGGEYTNLASIILSLLENISGNNLPTAKKTLLHIQTVFAAYSALDGREKEDLQKESALDIEAQLQDILAAHMRKKGFELIHSTDVHEVVIEGYLSNYYLGLYYIGRSGHQLTAQEVDTHATTLRSLHSQADPVAHRPLVDWYQTVGVSRKETLLSLLQGCPLVQKLHVDPRYIAYALNQQDATLSFDGILDDLLNHFPS